MNLIKQIIKILIYLLAYSFAASQSFFTRIKVFAQKPILHFEHPYESQPILLLALYEKGLLRPDIMNLLQVAKDLGMYVVAVNTMKILAPEQLKAVVDCYIERPNFGRDFGSYKTGFLHVYKKEWNKKCPRLLMLNDSVYFSKQRLKTFLKEMIVNDQEVIGATENFERQHHLGSFCISIDKKVLNNVLLKNFWKQYRCTDIRPRVIRSGEIRLSKILRSSLTYGGLTAFYDKKLIVKYFLESPNLIHEVTSLCRNSVFSQRTWKNYSPLDVAKMIFLKLGANKKSESLQDLHLSYLPLKHGLQKDDKQYLQSEFVTEATKEVFFEAMDTGSQIHNNAILFHKLGLPLIKCDLLFRGVCTTIDILTLSDQLTESEAKNFQGLMFSKTYGGKCLFGFNKILFRYGFI